MYQDEPSQARHDDKTAEGLIWIVTRTLSASVVVFLRRDFGEHFLGVSGVLVLVVVPLFAGCFPGHDPVPLLSFLAAYFAMCVVARVGVVRRNWRGARLHSQYSGTPRLATLLPSVPETVLKRWVEPPLVIFTGLLIVSWNDPLGSFLFWAGCALAVGEHLNGMWDRQQITRMHDAYLEQSHTNGRFRRLRAGA
jgi:hypothetical protein